MARNYRKLLSLAVCATMGLSSFTQTWKNVAVNKLNNGKFKEVEQIISDLNTKEQKDNAIFIDSLQHLNRLFSKIIYHDNTLILHLFHL